MRPRTLDTVEKGRRNDSRNRPYIGTNTGLFVLKGPGGVRLLCIADAGTTWEWPDLLSLPAWEHVSVSVYLNGQPPGRCPTWDEMQWVKRQFWDDTELVVQIHPPQAEYVNDNEFVLHLWKPVGVTLPLPPRECVQLERVCNGADLDNRKD